MPELPEVETVARELRRRLPQKKIQNIEVLWPRTFDARSEDHIEGRQIVAVGRHAKYILIHLDSGFLVVHLRMTGQLLFYDSAGLLPDDKYFRVIFGFEGGSMMAFKDVRKFGRIYHVDSLDPLLGHVGKDAMDPSWTVEKFKEVLQASRMNIKAFLLSQKYISGMGNIYVDEALFRSRLHPSKAAAEISARKAGELFRNIRDVLSFAIKNMGSTISDYRDPRGVAGSNQLFFKVYDREGRPCTRCGRTIVKMRFAGRGTHYCPSCQKKSR